MHAEMEIPSTLPVMALPEVVFFPRSILPLRVFEERYRLMLRDVLAGNRLFVIAHLDERAQRDGLDEPLHRVATVGMVRASHTNPDGTSQLVLQGLCRVEIDHLLEETPYRQARIIPRVVEESADTDAVLPLKEAIACLLTDEPELAEDVPTEFLEFLLSLDDLEAFIDLIAYSVCPCPATKQRMLETYDLAERYQVFLDYLRRQQAKQQFFRTLQGPLSDEQIVLN